MENELNGAESEVDPLVVKPQSIDFGSLSHGQGATVTLNIRGGPGNVAFSSDHFRVTPTSFTHDGSDVEITLLGGSSGELVWDEIVLQTDAQEIRVPVTARWEVRELERLVDTPAQIPVTTRREVREPDRPIDTTTQAPIIQQTKARAHSKDQRTFKGRVCSRCGKNFAYDENAGAWEQCSCNWYQMLVNMSTHLITELRLGIKYLPSALKETWYVLLGKEK